MTEHLPLILGMALVTYFSRAVPLLLLSSRELPPALLRWLEMIPPAILAALLMPTLLLHTGADGDPRLFFGADNLFFLAAIPTGITGWLTRSFFGAVAAGMGALAVLRLFSA